MHGFNKVLLALFMVITVAATSPLCGEETPQNMPKYGHTVAQIGRTGLQMMENGKWKKAREHFEHLIQSRPQSMAAKEAMYLSAVCSFRLGDLDLAHNSLQEYLKSGHQKYFDEAINLQFEVAELFRKGGKRHLFGKAIMPKWLSGYEQALETYDHVIVALPGKELAAKAMFAKGWLLVQMVRYREAAEAFQMFLVRYPSHEAAASAHLWLARIYVDHQKLEVRNPDLMAMAEINLERYRNAFPQDGRIKLAEKALKTMREIYAHGLLNTAEFYAKLGKPEASIVYFRNAIRQFPDTEVAKTCEERLHQTEQFLAESPAAVKEPESAS